LLEEKERSGLTGEIKAKGIQFLGTPTKTIAKLKK
jgi:hypothetical protein